MVGLTTNKNLNVCNLVSDDGYKEVCNFACFVLVGMMSQSKGGKILELKEHLQMQLHLPPTKNTSETRTRDLSELYILKQSNH